MTISEANQQILEAHKLRAVMYYYLYDEMEKTFGEDMARQIFKRAAFRRGQDIQRDYHHFLETRNYDGLADKFCKSSPAEGMLFHPGVEEVDSQRAVLIMETCPLVSAWKEMGLPEEKIKTLCEAASAIDNGTFESETTELVFTHQIGKGDSMCRLIIQDKRS
ncbi:MAG TPA: L-2-amino-thiazoline-4-carboxylic acid hydrolase [Thermodesulfovibrionia bacterium]|nr:L-2-amino-thiazoline-4-carboxylic acid hydrolase [Thermodesulfovibrionia bacterium]